MLNQLLKSGLTFTTQGNILNVAGPTSIVEKQSRCIARHKFELLRIANHETVSGVGVCNQCGHDLLGIVVDHGFVNRTCPECGKWFHCVVVAELSTASKKAEHARAAG